MNSKTELNIAENRNHLNYSKWVYVKRILWTFGKFLNPEKPDVPLNKNDAFQKVQKRRVQEKR